MHDILPEDPETCAMPQKADSVGAFQGGVAGTDVDAAARALGGTTVAHPVALFVDAASHIGAFAAVDLA